MGAHNIKITFLGTNGWYDTSTGNTICTLIETPSEYVVLDAGNGLYKLDQYIKFAKPIYLFISHFHLDHVIGLHVLAKFKFQQKIYFCLPQHYRRAFAAIMGKVYTAPLSNLKLDIQVLFLPARAKAIMFLERYLVLVHSQPSFGMRFNFPGQSIAYIPDSGPCPNALKLAAGVDCLITECAFKPGQTEKGWPHLTPLTAARLAQAARAKRLILTHFDAAVYRTIKERKIAARQARNIFKQTVAAIDNLTIKLAVKEDK